MPAPDCFLIQGGSMVQVEDIIGLTPVAIFKVVIPKAGIAIHQVNADPFAVIGIWKTFRHHRNFL